MNDCERHRSSSELVIEFANVIGVFERYRFLASVIGFIERTVLVLASGIYGISDRGIERAKF